MDYADYMLEGEQNPRCKQLCSFLFALNIMPRTVSLITGVCKLHFGTSAEIAKEQSAAVCVTIPHSLEIY